MLVLTRKPDEEILIGKDIIIRVIEVGRGKVRLGITAPRDTTVFRRELLTDDTPRPAAPPDGFTDVTPT